MSAVLNDRLLRKFFFAVLEDTFGTTLNSNYGIAITVPDVINVGDTLDEVEFCKGILDKIIIK